MDITAGPQLLGFGPIVFSRANLSSTLCCRSPLSTALTKNPSEIPCPRGDKRPVPLCHAVDHAELFPHFLGEGERAPLISGNDFDHVAIIRITDLSLSLYLRPMNTNDQNLPAGFRYYLSLIHI